MAVGSKERGYEDFYWVDRNDARLTQHLANWTKRNIELIDQYQPDLIWFDNGLNHRVFDPLKLSVVAYYDNRAREWQKDVTVTGSGTCFISGGCRTSRTCFVPHDRLIDTWGLFGLSNCRLPNLARVSAALRSK
jgi:hypothetical protein